MILKEQTPRTIQRLFLVGSINFNYSHFDDPLSDDFQNFYAITYQNQEIQNKNKSIFGKTQALKVTSKMLILKQYFFQ